VACTSAEHQGHQGWLERSGALQPIAQVSARNETGYNKYLGCGCIHLKLLRARKCARHQGHREESNRKKSLRGENHFDSEK
jgi:hypothetical protein